MIRARLAQAQLALMLLTRLPAGRLPEPAPSIAAATWAFPLAGLAVGGVAAVVLLAALTLGLPPALAAGLALAAQIIVTGALHEDGLADLADGFWGGRDAARRLEIMRDSRIGSYGTLALVVSVGLRWQALAVLAGQGPMLAVAAVLAVAMTSRAVPAVLLAVMPPARADGMGHLASGGNGGAVIAAILLAGAPALAVPGMVPAMAVQALLAFALARLSLARIGGQTGDVLGAAQQLAEVAALLVLAAA